MDLAGDWLCHAIDWSRFIIKGAGNMGMARLNHHIGPSQTVGSARYSRGSSS